MGLKATCFVAVAFVAAIGFGICSSMAEKQSKDGERELLANESRLIARRESRPPVQLLQEQKMGSTRLAGGTVTFHEGYETDRRDGGRPVVLIASALGVEPQVFRDAFSGVRPARGRGPTGAEARANKEVLMKALGKYGITNDRLDTVSNHYRYRPQNGELWKHRPAKAKAIIEDGKITGFQIEDAGNGYSSAPKIEVVGYPELRVQSEIEYTRDLATNGRVVSLTIVP